MYGYSSWLGEVALYLQDHVIHEYDALELTVNVNHRLTKKWMFVTVTYQFCSSGFAS